jgi:hypothetical protein
MAAGKFNFVIEQGTTLDFDVEYKDSNNAAVDLSDYTGRMQIKDKIGGNTTHITLSSTLSSGKIKVFISANSSSALDFSKAVYDLEIVSGSTFPVVTRLLQGSVTLDKEVTTVS